MQFIDHPLATPEENLACDEAVLNACETGAMDETLRVWESPSPFVVVGFGNPLAEDVDREACHQADVPIFRRVSGGGTVVQGPGCLNFSLVLRLNSCPEYATIRATNHVLLHRIAAMLQSFARDTLVVRGVSDLAIGGRKISGTAQRRGRRCLLFHGTLLLNFDIALIGQTLRMPQRVPPYRRGRTHEAFLTNLGADPASVTESLRHGWRANNDVSLPLNQIERLVHDKYTRPTWRLG